MGLRREPREGLLDSGEYLGRILGRKWID